MCDFFLFSFFDMCWFFNILRAVVCPITKRVKTTRRISGSSGTHVGQSAWRRSSRVPTYATITMQGALVDGSAANNCSWRRLLGWGALWREHCFSSHVSLGRALPWAAHLFLWWSPLCGVGFENNLGRDVGRLRGATCLFLLKITAIHQRKLTASCTRLLFLYDGLFKSRSTAP